MSSSPSAAPPRAARPPFRILLTILHLAALGLFGWAVVSVLLMLFAVGIGTAILLGIGLLFLGALVYALFGTAWFETERVRGLYDLPVPTLTLQRPSAPGFGAYLRAMAWQSIDGRMWRGVASFVVATTLGTTLLVCVQSLVWSAIAVVVALGGGDPAQDPTFGTLFGLLPGLGGPLLGALNAIVAAAAAIGLALLHRVITVAIARAGARTQQLARQVQTTARQREGAVRAADVERTRIERDLHDGVQPRLVSVGMTLGLAQQQIDDDPEGAKALISEAHTSTKAAITELRQLARGIHASVLDDRGLDAALSALAGRSHIPVVLDVRLDGRCSREAETAVYFAIAESLTNAAKHSRASECRVVVRLREGGLLWARVEDNGVGGARVLPGGGLDGITNRIEAAGGSVRIDSPQGGPTTLEVSVPCAS
ncbi:sensor histidine kinase [Leucobacter luti]|uniref:histidine kinase n=1 Tax=Leucobacter luti TaxID=340320 RepID=A0A4Q7U341_9MICO|nr:sensor histidine kinase [Leucobacter luti]MBL3699509.1 sensor histidine kinase [Leucobacter luti]RZT67020.1 signal transduction histidine kinase [Leucobacter luti]